MAKYAGAEQSVITERVVRLPKNGVMVDTDGGQTENPGIGSWHWRNSMGMHQDRGIPEEQVYHMIPYSKTLVSALG